MTVHPPLAIEPFVTLKDAARTLHVPYWKLQRGARRGLLTTYRFLNARPLVRLSEVVAIIEASRGRDGND